MASSSNTEIQKMIVLQSSDGQIFEIEESVASNSQTLRNMIEDECADNTIPLPNVTAKILARVIEYCKRHTDAAANADDLKKFDADFVDPDDQETLFDTLLAANYLNISSLMDMLCKAIAEMLKDKDPEVTRKKFNIVNDYTKEEEEEVRKENSWAFED
ncbi:hypothetical protein ABFS82_02G007500 [Erythranthe guttata]|uniref:SKP1-like protein n=1 Tax=Erythranthe guttata TaxID=4155 RepID=A0A022RGF9_ERYGU|nr:PREDICTED: SKP1-like protein 4 [Erythranthe guttata]EYU37960.1 hypothetical protein MIMGU_mgv1a015408mg [Erythranthe guttata]|eukprot:XP_012837189.1 PREDICTED: SKP1-like protein 4 [Erythranthe guttata]